MKLDDDLAWRHKHLAKAVLKCLEYGSRHIRMGGDWDANDLYLPEQPTIKINLRRPYERDNRLDKLYVRTVRDAYPNTLYSTLGKLWDGSVKAISTQRVARNGEIISWAMIDVLPLLQPPFSAGYHERLTDGWAVGIPFYALQFRNAVVDDENCNFDWTEPRSKPIVQLGPLPYEAPLPTLEDVRDSLMAQKVMR